MVENSTPGQSKHLQDASDGRTLDQARRELGVRDVEVVMFVPHTQKEEIRKR